MMASYIEWSAGATALAKSGQLSTAASQGVMELAESLALAPAACLDYFDAVTPHREPNTTRTAVTAPQHSTGPRHSTAQAHATAQHGPTPQTRHAAHPRPLSR